MATIDMQQMENINGLDSLRSEIAQLSQQVRLLSDQLSKHGSTATTTGNFQRIKTHELEFPRFDGTEVENWLVKCDEFYSLGNVNDDLKVNLAVLHATYEAMVWYRNFLCDRKCDVSLSWDDLKLAITAEFWHNIDEYGDPIAEIVDAQQVFDEMPEPIGTSKQVPDGARSCGNCDFQLSKQLMSAYNSPQI